MPRALIAALFAGILALAGCGGEIDDESQAEPTDAAEEVQEEALPARVTITSPEDQAEVGSSVTFTMEVQGISIEPAGVMDPGTGHHHLIVNGDVDWENPIPNDPGVHYHMGLAQTEFTIEGLPPGNHRVISVVADGVHVPLDPPVSDTIWITVR